MDIDTAIAFARQHLQDDDALGYMLRRVVASLEMPDGSACPPDFLAFIKQADPRVQMNGKAGSPHEAKEPLEAPSPTRRWASETLDQLLATEPIDARSKRYRRPATRYGGTFVAILALFRREPGDEGHDGESVARVICRSA